MKQLLSRWDIRVFLAFLIFVGILFGTAAKSRHDISQEREHGDDRAARNTLISCDRANTFAADRYIDSLDPDDNTRERLRVTRLFFIQDCSVRAKHGRVQLLPPQAAMRFVRLVYDGHVPIVRNGKIYLTHPRNSNLPFIRPGRRPHGL